MDWNIRGINSQDICDDLADKIKQSNCNIICLQETKREHFDSSYIRKFCPRRLKQFAYQPSLGNSGGHIIIWNGAQFNGQIISQSHFQMTIKFESYLTAQTWYLTNIYAPCTNEGRQLFFDWFMQLDSSAFDLWMVMGDFNMIRSTNDRNRPGGNIANINNFNAII